MEYYNTARIAITLKDDFTGAVSIHEMNDITYPFPTKASAARHTERAIKKWIVERRNNQGNTLYSLVSWEEMKEAKLWEVTLYGNEDPRIVPALDESGFQMIGGEDRAEVLNDCNLLKGAYKGTGIRFQYVSSVEKPVIKTLKVFGKCFGEVGIMADVEKRTFGY
jgi:hypothetical protein